MRQSASKVTLRIFECFEIKKIIFKEIKITVKSQFSMQISACDSINLRPIQVVKDFRISTKKTGFSST